jgi:hypothetical protein
VFDVHAFATQCPVEEQVSSVLQLQDGAQMPVLPPSPAAQAGPGDGTQTIDGGDASPPPQSVSTSQAVAPGQSPGWLTPPGLHA